jgi:hypothetical protein
MKPQVVVEDPNKIVIKSTTPKYTISLDTGLPVFVTNLKGRQKPYISQAFEPIVSGWFKANKDMFVGQTTLPLFTTATQEDGKETYRATPEFDARGAWYDWAMINFEIEEGEVNNAVPGKLLCFFRMLDGTEMALAHCCGWHKDMEGPFGRSILCEQWRPEFDTKGCPILHCFDLTCINEPVLVIEKYPHLFGIPVCIRPVASIDKHTIIRFLDRKRDWPEYFLKFGKNLLQQTERQNIFGLESFLVTPRERRTEEDSSSSSSSVID